MSVYSSGSGQFMNVFWNNGGGPFGQGIEGFASGVFLKDPVSDPYGGK